MSKSPGNDSIDLCGLWEICPQTEGGAAPTAGDGDWRSIQIPCAWQTVLGSDFHGTAWLRRNIELPQSWRNETMTRLWLRFEAVATDLRAFINGKEVGHHVGDYVPFQFKITSTLVGTDFVEILLRVDEIHAPKVKPGELQSGHLTKGFHDVISIQHGGVWQPVRLSRTGRLCAIPDGVGVISDPLTGEVRIEIQLEPRGDGARGAVEVKILDADGKRVDDASHELSPHEQTCTLSLRVAHPKRWSPHEPILYTAHVRLLEANRGSESHEIRFGFRSIEAIGPQIQLNASPLFLRGILHWGPNQVISPRCRRLMKLANNSKRSRRWVSILSACACGIRHDTSMTSLTSWECSSGRSIRFGNLRWSRNIEKSINDSSLRSCAVIAITPR